MNQHERNTNRCFWWFLILAPAMSLCECTKHVISEDNYVYDKYQLINDWYPLDTSFLVKRFVLWEDDSIWQDETRLVLDTAKDSWLVECSHLDYLQHWYYVKNGKKIQPSAYPKNNE